MLRLAAVCLAVGQQLCGCCPERGGSEGCFLPLSLGTELFLQGPGHQLVCQRHRRKPPPVWLRPGDTSKVAILALYLGDKYQDTAISELIPWVP